MISGRILIKNGFWGTEDCYLLSCEIIEGSIEINDFIVISDSDKLKIHSIEFPMKELPSNIIMGIAKDEQVSVFDMYGKVYTVESGGSVQNVACENSDV